MRRQRTPGIGPRPHRRRQQRRALHRRCFDPGLGSPSAHRFAELCPVGTLHRPIPKSGFVAVSNLVEFSIVNDDLAPAGWYPDPDPIPGLSWSLRWWDGERWAGTGWCWTGRRWTRRDITFAGWYRWRRAHALPAVVLTRVVPAFVVVAATVPTLDLLCVRRFNATYEMEGVAWLVLGVGAIALQVRRGASRPRRLPRPPRDATVRAMQAADEPWRHGELFSGGDACWPCDNAPSNVPLRHVRVKMYFGSSGQAGDVHAACLRRLSDNSDCRGGCALCSDGPEHGADAVIAIPADENHPERRFPVHQTCLTNARTSRGLIGL